MSVAEAGVREVTDLAGQAARDAGMVAEEIFDVTQTQVGLELLGPIPPQGHGPVRSRAHWCWILCRSSRRRPRTSS
jgi:hypothetical protein